MKSLFTQLLSPVICLLLIIGCVKAPPEDNTLSSSEMEEGWQLLFDGKTTNGWRSYLSDGITGWEVEDGTLKALGLGGDLGGDIITEGRYENLELKLEWKISPGGNSGILYLVQEDTAYDAVYETGPEYQLIDDEGWPGELEDWQLTGANYAMHIAENKELKPVGEWNSSMIIVDHGRVEHWLNGAKVVEYELWSEDWEKRVAEGKWSNYPDYGKLKEGHISLQDHGSVTWFKNIKIREF
jgi:hypothetical protein